MDRNTHQLREQKSMESGSETSVLSKSDPSERHTRIEQLAYKKAQERGFEVGRAWEDWFTAEREVGESEGAVNSNQSNSAG
jgi:hypothetical protein